MSDRNAPLLPHELDAIPDEHLRDRIKASLEEAQVQSAALADGFEDKIDAAREQGKTEAEDEWTDAVDDARRDRDAAQEHRDAAVGERDALYRAVDTMVIKGLLHGNKKSIKKGLLEVVELLQKSELIDPVEAAELQGAADYLGKAAT